MKLFKPHRAILCIAIFISNSLPAQDSDTVHENQNVIHCAGGLVLPSPGIFVSCGYYRTNKHFFAGGEYNYSAADRFQNNSFKGFLTQRHFITALIGYQLPFGRFVPSIGAGLDFGYGRIGINPGGPFRYSPVETTAYINTGFIGFAVQLNLKYRLTKHMSAGVVLSSFFNYYQKLMYEYSGPNPPREITYLESFYGMQIRFSYVLKQHKK